MATQVVMPKLSPTMEEGQLARWLKNEGDKVSVGEPLAEIDTDKATMEAQALASGVLRKILVPAGETGVRDDSRNAALGVSADAGPEARLLSRERRARLAAAIDRLDGRQRTVFMLCHYGDHTPREVSAITGLNESTVRVHLFRAARKLRSVLGGQP